MAIMTGVHVVLFRDTRRTAWGGFSASCLGCQWLCGGHPKAVREAAAEHERNPWRS